MPDEISLVIVELLLSAEIFNTNTELVTNDLTPRCRELFSHNGSGEVKRPVVVSESIIGRVLGISDIHERVNRHPLIRYEEFGHRLHLTNLDLAVQWFRKNDGLPYIMKNPSIAYYLEKTDKNFHEYENAKKSNPKFEDTRQHLDARIARALEDDERLRSGLDLIIVSAPEEVESSLEDLICTQEQKDIIKKVHIAQENRDFLKKHRIHEVGKLLFVGPPGTGKTSLALALSKELHLPLLEVRLSMITSQYLGETSKNLDRIFDFAKKLSPSILFIDEFDFVAKSRVTDDHGAMKRAVNSLLKNIDQVSLVKNGVLLIAATNHPQLLDEAAWRRFDEIVPFELPDILMREAIINSVVKTLTFSADLNALAANTEGLSGADLRMLVKEAIMNALMDKRESLVQKDFETGLHSIKSRSDVRHMKWI